MALMEAPTKYAAATALMKRLGVQRHYARRLLAKARERLASEHKQAIDDLLDQYSTRWSLAWADARAAKDLKAQVRLLAQTQGLLAGRDAKPETEPLTLIEFRTVDVAGGPEDATEDE